MILIKSRLASKMLALLVLLSVFFIACGKEEKLEIKAPVLKGVSKDAVLLRYKWVKGQVLKSKLDMQVDMKVSAAGQNFSIPVLMTMAYNLKTVDVDEKKVGTLEMRISRITMKVASPIGQGIDFDSAKQKKAPSKEMQSLLDMLNQPITFKSTKLGKVFKMNMDSMLDKLKNKKNQKTIAQVKQMLDNMSDTAFSVLPEKAVKVGSIYKSPSLRRKLRGFDMVISVNNKIGSISQDKKSAVIETTGDIKLGGSGRFKMTMESGQMAGWTLFDVAKGNAKQAVLKMKIKMSYTVRGVDATVVANMKISNKTEL